MEITNKKGRVLDTFENWEKGFIEVDEKLHWEPGYSAHSLGLFFTEKEGQKWLDELVKSILGCSLEYSKAEIEHESKLDSYKGKHRMQDLAIWGKCPDGRSVFIAIEAKVLESFGNYSVKDEYEIALDYRKNEKPESKKPNRVEEVVDRLFPGKTPKDEEVCNLRYQLMHYFVASIKEGADYNESKKSIKKRKKNADIVILPVLVFNTEHYQEDQETAAKNKSAYDAFCEALKMSNDRETHYKRIGDVEVYTCYQVVDLKNNN